MRKASVLPLPVLAAPRMSRPFRARGMARDWMSVRTSKWEARRPDAVGMERGRSVKFLISVDFRSCKLGKLHVRLLAAVWQS